MRWQAFMTPVKSLTSKSPIRARASTWERAVIIRRSAASLAFFGSFFGIS